MGLDLVELTIRIEDAFGIPIPDEIAADLTTPRQVKFYVLSQLKLAERKTCMSQQAFYLLRREFVPVLGIQRPDFHPASKLAHLIATEDRIPTWTTLKAKIGAKGLPDLKRPTWLFWSLMFGTLATAVATFIFVRVTLGRSDIALLFSLLTLGALGHVSARLTQHLKREFPDDCAHAGDVAKYLALHSPHSFKKEWTGVEVAQTLRQIIIDVTGVDDFTEDSRFVADMHLE